MTMDLWYDLAVREHPAQDDVVEKLGLGDDATPEEERPAPQPPAAVDFF
jgi:hypothetical protein